MGRPYDDPVGGIRRASADTCIDYHDRSAAFVHGIGTSEGTHPVNPVCRIKVSTGITYLVAVRLAFQGKLHYHSRDAPGIVKGVPGIGRMLALPVNRHYPAGIIFLHIIEEKTIDFLHHSTGRHGTGIIWLSHIYKRKQEGDEMMSREELAKTIAPEVQRISSLLKETDHVEVSVNITAEGGKVVDCIQIPEFCRERE